MSVALRQPAIIFDGAHAGLIQVLRVGAAVAIPSVVGNVHQELRALIGELADFIGKYRFVADEHAEAFVFRRRAARARSRG